MTKPKFASQLGHFKCQVSKSRRHAMAKGKKGCKTADATGAGGGVWRWASFLPRGMEERSQSASTDDGDLHWKGSMAVNYCPELFYIRRPKFVRLPHYLNDTNHQVDYLHKFYVLLDHLRTCCANVMHSTYGASVAAALHSYKKGQEPKTPLILSSVAAPCRSW